MSGFINKVRGLLKPEKPRRHWKKGNVLPVVGEFYYREACQKFANLENTRSIVFFAARLEPDNENPHDANAVAIFGEKLKLGHLSRSDAEKYRSAVGEESTVCDAVMSGGGVSGDNPRNYEILVHLDFENAPSRRTKPIHLATRLQAQAIFAKQSKKGTYIGPIDDELSKLCQPGDVLTAWHQDGMDTVHLFLKGTAGGQGRVGIVDLQSLNAAGLDLDSIVCVVKDVGQFFVIVDISPS